MTKEAVKAAIHSILGSEIGIGITDPRAPSGPLWEVEKPAIARAIPKRVAEFTAGRQAARAAMADLGLPPAPVLMRDDRAPVWPAGQTGSIAHCADLCIAVVSQSHQSLGIDVEPASPPLPAELEEIVCTASERAWLDMLPSEARALHTKKIFSAKEATYKAQYPLTGQVIGFEEVEIEFDAKLRTFKASLLRQHHAHSFWQHMNGLCIHVRGSIISFSIW